MHVIIVDDLSSGYKWLPPSDARVSVVVGDVCDVAGLGIDATDAWVFHLAAFFANQNSVDHPMDDLRTNGLGTLAVLDWASRGGARRLVYASAGCSIAGHGTNEPIHEDMPVSLHLDTPYQITKALGEFYCNYFNQRISTVRCRFFNSYGPGEVPGRYRNVIPNFVWQALRNEDLVITGTGEETRDFIYVDDLVDGLMRSAERPDVGGRAFNLGTGRETKVVDLARLVITMCDSRSRIAYARRRAWDHSSRRQASISRATTELEFSPRVPLETGIERTVAWFRNNIDDIAASVKEGR